MKESRYKRFYRKHKEKRKKAQLDYTKKTKGESQKAYNLKFKNAVYEILGKKCVKCRYSDIRALQVDHINGGGTKERKTIKGNYYSYILKEIANNPNKYQILCANCNWVKKYENKEDYIK